ncbi:MAG: Ig domain-containing protein [Lachnospiraceae bacterium]|nr:Ig domain-containing protein [Lachnospiraceae bacterium]
MTSVKLNKTVLTLNRGKSFTLRATAAPSNANNKNVRWTTSNKAVATVTSKGVVKGIKKGTVTITATAADGSGKKATCRITVK